MMVMAASSKQLLTVYCIEIVRENVSAKQWLRANFYMYCNVMNMCVLYLVPLYSEELYEDESFRHREISALVASKVCMLTKVCFKSFVT